MSWVSLRNWASIWSPSAPVLQCRARKSTMIGHYFSRDQILAFPRATIKLPWDSDKYTPIGPFSIEKGTGLERNVKTGQIRIRMGTPEYLSVRVTCTLIPWAWKLRIFFPTLKNIPLCALLQSINIFHYTTVVNGFSWDQNRTCPLMSVDNHHQTLISSTVPNRTMASHWVSYNHFFAYPPYYDDWCLILCFNPILKHQLCLLIPTVHLQSE